jgi:hypothetical protein
VACSIARVVNTISTTAWMLPSYDPTWSSPATLILATLEVDIASICASVPIFWPVLSSKFLEVFVVKEVIVERVDRTDRRASMGDSSDHDGMGLVVSQEALLHKKCLQSMFDPVDPGRNGSPFATDVDPRGDMFGVASYIEATAQPKQHHKQGASLL